MRGIYTPVTDIRRKVFTEVARMAYEVNEMHDFEYLMRELPFKIIPGEEKSLRSSIFLERAIVSERVRLAMGMSLRPLDESVPASEGLEHPHIPRGRNGHAVGDAGKGLVGMDIRRDGSRHLDTALGGHHAGYLT